MTKRLVWSAVAVCVFALLAAGSADDDDDRSSSSTGSGIDERVQTYSVGDPFRAEFEGVVYQVERVVVKDELGSDSTTESAGPRAAFVVVYSVVKNDSDTTRPVSTDDLDLVDADDRKYDAFSKANPALQEESNRDLLLSEIEPDTTKMVAAAYRVPEGVVTEPFHLVVPGKRFVSDQKIRVEVTPDEIEDER